MRYVSIQQGGVQEIRTKISNALFGARVVYGETMFVIISPSSRHSGLAMRLSQLRAHDPLLGHEDMPLKEAEEIGSASYSLVAMEEDVLVDLPGYDARKCWRGRDGLCIFDAFKVYIMLGVARVFGVRTCPFVLYAIARK